MSKNIYLFSTSSHPDAININTLDIKFLKPSINFSKYDYFIITSKQASKSLQQYEYEEYISKKALCVSQQSANSFKELGGKILDIGEGYGDTLVEKIKSFPRESRWLYLRANIIASNFVEICKKAGYKIDEKILYESECAKDIENLKIEENAILIFTSPSSVQCFLNTNKIEKKHQIIVIGKTTAKALPKGVTYLLSEDKSINNCIDIAKNL